MSRILIIGDSWGCGEWGHLCKEHLVLKENCGCKPPNIPQIYAVTHPGLEQYLRERGCFVTNISRGSGSNMESLFGAEKACWWTYDYVFWFFTDPLRDWEPESVRRSASENKGVLDLPAFMEAYRHNTLIPLDYASEMIANSDRCMPGHKHNKFHIIGANHNPSNDLVASYEFLNMGCRSMTELFCPDIKPSVYKGLVQFNRQRVNYYKDIKFSEELVDYLEHEQDLFEQYRFLWPEEFCFGGDSHPNRLAHKLLFGHLNKKLNFNLYSDL